MNRFTKTWASKPSAGMPQVDDVRLDGFLHQRLAALAGPLAAYVAVLRKNWVGTMSSFSLTSSPTRTIGWPQSQVVLSGS